MLRTPTRAYSWTKSSNAMNIPEPRIGQNPLMQRIYTAEGQLFILEIAWLTGSYVFLPVPSIMREYLPHVTSLEVDQNSKFEVWLPLNVYCFHTIVKSKHLKSSHLKSETVYLVLISLLFSDN